MKNLIQKSKKYPHSRKNHLSFANPAETILLILFIISFKKIIPRKITAARGEYIRPAEKNIMEELSLMEIKFETQFNISSTITNTNWSKRVTKVNFLGNLNCPLLQTSF